MGIAMEIRLNIPIHQESASLSLCLGAAIGAAGYNASVAFSDGGFNNWNWGSFAGAVGVGALSGSLTNNIGAAFGQTRNFGYEALRAGTHAFSNGMMSQMGGGEFSQGFMSGAFSSFGGHAFDAITNGSASLFELTAYSAISGGIGAELSGGDFWRGAATGATVGLLNAGGEKLKNALTSKDNGTPILQGERKGYNRVWKNSFENKSEYGFLVTPDGLITFDIGENGGSLYGGLKSTWKGGKNYVRYKERNYQVLGSGHVHWDKTLDPWPSNWDPTTGDGDRSAAYYTFKGKLPIFILGHNNRKYSVSYRYDYSNYLNNYNVHSLLNGHLSLINILR